jgi:hypothetical protein
MVTRLLGTTLLLVCPALLAAQTQNAPLSLHQELARLGEAALSLQHDLPSFACTETGLSEVIRKNKVKQHVQFVAGLRVERNDEGRLMEHLDVTQVNGKPFSGRGFHPPFMVQGGFGESLFFFLPTTQACFNFRLGQGRIEFDSPPGTFDRPECTETGAPRGFALLDDDGNATHLERQVLEEYALQMHVVNFTAIDFSPVELDGKVYPLTSKMMADVPKDGAMLHFEATYSGCRLFKASSRVLPDVTPVPGAPRPEQQPEQQPHR